MPSPVRVSALRFNNAAAIAAADVVLPIPISPRMRRSGSEAAARVTARCAAVEGEGEIGGAERGLLAEVAAAAARLVGDDAGHRRFRKRAGVDDFERRAEFARQHGNRGASGGEIRHHRDRDFLRIGGDTLRGNAVIAGEHDDRHAIGARAIGVLQARELDRERLRAGRARRSAW